MSNKTTWKTMYQWLGQFKAQDLIGWIEAYATGEGLLHINITTYPIGEDDGEGEAVICLDLPLTPMLDALGGRPSRASMVALCNALKDARMVQACPASMLRVLLHLAEGLDPQALDNYAAYAQAQGYKMPVSALRRA